MLTAKSSSIADRDYITRMIFRNIYWCWHTLLFLFSLPFTCLGLGYCSCLSSYILFLIHFSICIHFTLSRCGLSTWINVLIDWLILRLVVPCICDRKSYIMSWCCQYRPSLFLNTLVLLAENSWWRTDLENNYTIIGITMTIGSRKVIEHVMPLTVTLVSYYY